MLWKGCVISLWFSLGLPFDYSVKAQNQNLFLKSVLFLLLEFVYKNCMRTKANYHCLDRTPDCTFLGSGLLLPRWRTGKPARGRYLFYNHFISILIVIQYQRPDLRTLYAFLQSSLVSLSQKSHRYGYGGIISSPFVYILIF